MVSSFFNLFLLISYRCIGSSLLCGGFFSCEERELLSSGDVRASPCGGFSCCGAQALGTWASVVATRGLSS